MRQLNPVWDETFEYVLEGQIDTQSCLTVDVRETTVTNVSQA